MNIEKYNRDKRIANKESESIPYRLQSQSQSNERLRDLKHLSSFTVPDYFNPDEISWVLNNLAITDWEGGQEAFRQGYFVINVADEIDCRTSCKIPVEPFQGPEHTMDIVDCVSDVICEQIKGGSRVVVHCAMGMERSALCVMWYLHKYRDMTVDEAYSFIGKVRPIVADRRKWIGLQYNV